MFLWNDRSEYHYARLTETVTADSPAWLDYRARLAEQGITGEHALATTAQVLNHQAGTLGANDVFYLIAFLFTALIPVVWLARPPFRTIGMGGAH